MDKPSSKIKKRLNERKESQPIPYYHCDAKPETCNEIHRRYGKRYKPCLCHIDEAIHQKYDVFRSILLDASFQNLTAFRKAALEVIKDSYDDGEVDWRPIWNEETTLKDSSDRRAIKFRTNRYFVQRTREILEFLHERIPEEVFFALILDGEKAGTSCELRGLCQCLRASNILVPNFTSTYFKLADLCNNDPEYAPCQPLFMSVGPQLSPSLLSKLPVEVVSNNLISYLASFPIRFVAVWLDYCITPDSSWRDLAVIIRSIRFAPKAIFGITATFRGATNWAHGEALRKYVLDLLLSLPEVCTIRHTKRGTIYAPTFFFTLETGIFDAQKPTFNLPIGKYTQ